MGSRKRVSIKEFGLTREKALEIIEKINKNGNPSMLFLTDGNEDSFFISPEDIPFVEAYLNRNKVSEIENRIAKIEEELSILMQQRIENSKTESIKTIEEPKETTISKQIKLKSPEPHVLEFKPEDETEESEPEEKIVAYESKVFYCEKCGENKEIKVPIFQDKEGNTITKPIRKVVCPDCGYEIFNSLKNRKRKIIIVTGATSAVVGIIITAKVIFNVLGFIFCLGV